MSAPARTLTAAATRRKPAPADAANDEDAVSPSLRAQAYDRFTRKVVAGHLRPGQFVSQRELMRMLDMPLGAVREMIPRLEAARLMVTVPKRGLQIAHVDLKLIRNAFQVRAMIEREAVVHFLRHASDKEIAELEKAHKAILARAKSGKSDPKLDEDAQAVDWGLHDRMVDAMGNEILSEIYRVNSLHVRMIRLDVQQVRPRRVVPAMEEHLRFIALLKVRDEAAAVRAMSEHIESSRRRVLEAMMDRPA
jgi:DNA-binding GntR family transcriptional regulator